MLMGCRRTSCTPSAQPERDVYGKRRQCPKYGHKFPNWRNISSTITCAETLRHHGRLLPTIPESRSHLIQGPSDTSLLRSGTVALRKSFLARARDARGGEDRRPTRLLIPEAY